MSISSFRVAFISEKIISDVKYYIIFISKINENGIRFFLCVFKRIDVSFVLDANLFIFRIILHYFSCISIHCNYESNEPRASSFFSI